LLAAGGSSRLGFPKQLIQINGEYLINRIMRIIKSVTFQQFIVVLGDNAKNIQKHINDPEWQIEVNKEWGKGISSSIRYGVSSVDLKASAAIFFLVDQPFLTVEAIDKVIQKANATDQLITAMSVNSQIIHPICFKRELFVNLSQLKGDKGGKTLFIDFPPAIVESEDKKLLYDIDTIQDLDIVMSQN
jgi:molybdenum cofactor cytidylyltransferase